MKGPTIDTILQSLSIGMGSDIQEPAIMVAMPRHTENVAAPSLGFTYHSVPHDIAMVLAKRIKTFNSGLQNERKVKLKDFYRIFDYFGAMPISNSEQTTAHLFVTSSVVKTAMTLIDEEDPNFNKKIYGAINELLANGDVVPAIIKDPKGYIIVIKNKPEPENGLQTWFDNINGYQNKGFSENSHP